MAKGKSKGEAGENGTDGTEGKEGKEQEEKEIALPSGYDEVSSAQSSGWIVKEKGVIVEGELLGRFEKRRDDGAFYQIRLIREAKAVTGTGDEQETVMLQPGQICSIDEFALLEDLRPLTEDGGRYQVCIVLRGKEKLPNGNTPWRGKIGKKVLSPPTRRPPERNRVDSSTPF